MSVQCISRQLRLVFAIDSYFAYSSVTRHNALSEG